MTIGTTSELSAQLVLEIYVRDLPRSLAFYQGIGFELERRTETFAVVRWDENFLFLAGRREQPATIGASTANMRVIVSDVDAVWQRVQMMGAPVELSVGDRAFGLRTFIART